MKTEDLDRLLQLMLDKGFSQVVITDGRQRIAMKLETSSEAVPAETSGLPISPSISSAELRSPSIGTLLACHPLHAADGEGPAKGSRVVAGEPVAFIRAGNLLSAVVAPANGRLRRRLCEPGQPVGYASPIYEFFPDNDGKA